ncbi:hypothetical protein Bca52824_002413 [Brassica carinata]|uniref:DNA replication licensing factor MCM7 n=1 Tax=Brassica carinata TaxID=52824 RepID=A0A8X7WHV3_BRACI|nr:hypothetical protein Bca52824_002413 [Brassica carinata]
MISKPIKEFLANFTDANGGAKYLEILQEVANRKSRAIQVALQDIINYKGLDEFHEFMTRLTENTRRYVSIFSSAIDELLPEPTEAFPDDDHDILMTQRAENGTDNADVSDPPPSKGRPSTIREVKASHIGQLVRIAGIVTHCSDVKPLMAVAVYTCEDCGHEIYQAKMQELAEHVPKGHIPRSMTVHLRGELTRKVAPGDVVEFSGIFLPIPYTGFKALRAGLVADTYLEATAVTHFKKKYEEYEFQKDEEEQITRLAEDGDIYNKLSRSLAPEIYGHEDIKKALLLLLVGAPHRQLKDGMKIRGDVHICLMGDPGVAKSQLLKHIINVAPRGVYTTGKGSSGVGLTAAVMRDQVTNEMVLEGGALVLADMGICAIDEFDKMDESDRTAIHEVMEQQTVSIAKAGITTSLNARTAVLAAANPACDLELAKHVLHVHQTQESPALGFEPLETNILRSRRLSPSRSTVLEEYIATAYSSIRQEEQNQNSSFLHNSENSAKHSAHIRYSRALARLRFSESVAQSDVDEALRLMQMSKISLYADDRQKAGLDAISDTYSIIRDEAARSNKTHVSYANALNWISRKGYSEAQLKECLEEYAALNVWQIDPNTFDIRFI